MFWCPQVLRIINEAAWSHAVFNGVKWGCWGSLQGKKGEFESSKCITKMMSPGNLVTLDVIRKKFKLGIWLWIETHGVVCYLSERLDDILWSKRLHFLFLNRDTELANGWVINESRRSSVVSLGRIDMCQYVGYRKRKDCTKKPKKYTNKDGKFINVIWNLLWQYNT